MIFSFRPNLWKLLKAFICDVFLFSKSPQQGIPNKLLSAICWRVGIEVYLTASKIPCGMKLLTQSLCLSITRCVYEYKAEQSLQSSPLRELPRRFLWCYLCSDGHRQPPALEGFLFYMHFAESIFTAQLEKSHTADLCTLRVVIFLLLPLRSLDGS